MTLVGTALNLGDKMKSYPRVLTFFIKPQIWLFHVVVLLTSAKKWTKVKNARALIHWLKEENNRAASAARILASIFAVLCMTF